MIHISKDQKGTNTVTSFTDDEMQRVADYWTPERMKNAKPFPLSEKIENFSENIVGPAPVEVRRGPYFCGGRIFATDKHGGDHVGSAQFVGDCRILLTAAHCLTDSSGQLYSNIYFIRAYGLNGELYEHFDIQRVKVHPKWQGDLGNTTSIPFDYGFCYTTRPYKYRMGLQIGEPVKNQLRAIGYPSNYEHGRVMYAVNGTKYLDPEYEGYYGMKGNPMSHGCSGGAWIIDVTEAMDDRKNLVVGLNSRLTDDPELMLSPIFDKDTILLFNEVLHPCPTLIYNKDGVQLKNDFTTM